MTKKKLNITMKDPSGRTTAAGRAYFNETKKPKTEKTAVPASKHISASQGSILNRTLSTARNLAEKGRRLLERSKRPQKA